MREIPLTNRDFTVQVDDEDFDFLNQFTWYAKNSNPTSAYACTGLRVGGKSVTIRMHRMIMRCFDKNTVDHLDGDHFNNQRCNLEIVSRSINTKRYYAGVGISV